MSNDFDFVIVEGGSAGTALAARLSKDANVTVALVEAGGRPPEHEEMPVVCGSLQLDPGTDWMFTVDPGKGGRGFKNQTMPVPRRKMLGGSSGRKCLSITDVLIFDGEETRVAKQMCRGLDQSQYAIMV